MHKTDCIFLSETTITIEHLLNLKEEFYRILLSFPSRGTGIETYLLYSLIGKPKLILQIKNKPLTVSLLHFQSRPRGSKLHYILGRIYARIYPLDIGCLSCYNMCSGYIASFLKCYHFRTCEGGKPPFNPPFQKAERLIM